MEATLTTYKPPPPSSIPLKTHFLNPLHPPPSNSLPFKPPKTPPIPIRAAISRTKKEETIETVKQNLHNCHLLAGISYKGFTVQQFRDLRSTLPETTKLVVAKNTLVLKAIENTQWEALKPCMTGMNAWLFVHSEEIPAAIKPYRTFQKEKKVENDFAGAVFEGKYYAPEEFKALENMPTRAEVYAKLLGTLNAPGVKVVGTLQAPARNLLFVLKAYIRKLEEESGGGGSVSGLIVSLVSF